MDIPEVTLVNVLARLPLKSIARFRLVSKEWKLLIDSDFFRDYYISFNSSSSISWSIIQTKPHKLTLEIVGHYGCKSWGLSQSPGSLVSFFAKTTIGKLLVLACTDGLVSICAETSNGSPMYYIGNPLFQEWFRIPLPDFLSLQDLESLRKNNERFCDTGLVTKMQNCVVVSYKIVWMVRSTLFSNKLDFMVYSSETGIWKTEHVYCSCLCPTIWSRHDKSIALSGILHWLSQDNLTYDASSIVAYDFYEGHDDDDECRVIHFPGKDDELRRFRRTFTTSEGYIVYFNEFDENENRTLRVWRLIKYTNDPEAWQLCWELKLESFIESGIDYFPVVMHPLNSEIIYLWSMKKKGLILFNLRTHLSSFHKETEEDGKCMDGCVLSFNGCKEYMEEIYRYYLRMYQCLPSHLFFSQYVLPRWLYRLPRPRPQST